MTIKHDAELHVEQEKLKLYKRIYAMIEEKPDIHACKIWPLECSEFQIQ